MDFDLSAMMTNWAWLSEWTPEDAAEPRIVYFRKTVTLEEVPAVHTIRVSADSRYKLYVNGAFVTEGPQKAIDRIEWFVDTVDVAPYLTAGENVMAVEVLRYPEPNNSATAPNSNDSLIRTEAAHFFVEDDAEPLFAAKNGWKGTINREIRIFGEDAHPAPIHIQEDVAATGAFAGWQRPGYDDSAWQPAAPKLVFDTSAGDAPYNHVPRTIPAMGHAECRFEEVSAVREDGGIADLSAQVNALLAGKGTVTIPAHTKAVVEISAGAEKNGYLLYAFAGGAGAKVTTLCSECYAYPVPDAPSPFGGQMMPQNPKKGNRTDAVNGKLFGHTSFYTVGGYGTADAPETYEPYWFRTFRYIQLTVETADAPLAICDFAYRAVGYPLDVQTKVQASDPTFAPIWDICVRTLKRCMMETYFDCPFYEQLQYGMDSRSQILFTYMLSADDRLPRQCMEALRRSQRPDGLLNCDAPTIRSNIIPGFSIYYTLMVHDHMMYFGDRELVEHHFNTIDDILSFFDRNRNELGVVGSVGGPIMRTKYWSFIDWSTLWGSNAGVPNACLQGTKAITMESLLYLYGLQNAAECADFIGRTERAENYRRRASELAEAIRACCMGTYTKADGSGITLVQDGPGIDEYSVHCQVFAVLTGLVSPEEGRAMLETTVGNPDLAQSSVSFMFYLFRALERVGWYEKTDELWNLWRKMVANHMTTCVENDTDERSDCHAWASLMCYELPAVYLGVRPAAPGFEKVALTPQCGHLTEASGDVITPKGMVHVEWTKGADGAPAVTYTVPEGMEVI